MDASVDLREPRPGRRPDDDEAHADIPLADKSSQQRFTSFTGR